MNWKQPRAYAVKHKDEVTRAASRSGGIFTALSDQVLSNGGVVYGCVLTDDFNAVHIRTDNAEERNRMRGSKYIQSKLGDTFKNVKADLDERRSVLFSGTSCQVAGLKKYLVIIPGLSEPPVRTLRATIPGNESQLKLLILDD